MTVPVLPESAPFTQAQRAWLNGFFAGVMSLELSSSAPAATTNAMPAVEPPPSGDVVAVTAGGTEDFPWHDPTLSLAERLALAENKPTQLRLMAAMAQLDCGTCGYLCQTYAEAIAAGSERDLTKCTPGGRETARALREIVGGPAS
jgi:sulfite reductase (NADPH) flavoprotein alpha-component